MTRRLVSALAVFIAASACGSSGGSGAVTGAPTAPSSVTTTVSLSGTTRQTSAGGFNGCSGDTHSLTVQEGDVAITLVSTSDPAAALSVQICQGPSDTGVCSIKQQRINVGQRLSGVRTGTSNQVVKMLPFACVFGGAFDATPITYTVSVTYQQ